MFEVVGWIVSGIIAYFFFKPYWKHPVTRKKLIKGFLILFPLAVLFSFIGSYLINAGQPESFNEGVELVKQNLDVKNKIGGFKSLHFNQNDLPKDSDNPAKLRFELEGQEGRVLIECLVIKEGDDNWKVAEIIKDSLVEKY
ncbi:hypothetical protein GU926_04620 [Nibribacter ruber]|uniref:Uncharacterized protein n=1 Tax=Nibribacter ruber TaxID=2698458 RepID=A0A6P1NX39_9BACT|nr:hypothetical protein [Nibribacter ruber]QHL86759.1 hypothetical protein GU926_04620 [Nibribacter ruber]